MKNEIISFPNLGAILATKICSLQITKTFVTDILLPMILQIKKLKIEVTSVKKERIDIHRLLDLYDMKT